MNTKPGFKTTEFWLAVGQWFVLAGILFVKNVLHWEIPDNILNFLSSFAGINTAAYISGRSLVKAKSASNNG